MVLRQKGPRAAAKHDWRSEPEDPPVRSIESVDLRPSRPSSSRALATMQIPAAEAAETLPPPPIPTAPDTLKGLAPDMDEHEHDETEGNQRSVSGVRQKHGSKVPSAATVDEVTADLRRDARRE